MYSGIRTNSAQVFFSIQELVDIVVDKDQDLYLCSAVNRKFRVAARRRIFREVTLVCRNRCTSFYKLLDLDPDLAPLVRTLCITERNLPWTSRNHYLPHVIGQLDQLTSIRLDTLGDRLRRTLPDPLKILLSKMFRSSMISTIRLKHIWGVPSCLLSSLPSLKHLDIEWITLDPTSQSNSLNSGPDLPRTKLDSLNILLHADNLEWMQGLFQGPQSTIDISQLMTLNIILSTAHTFNYSTFWNILRSAKKHIMHLGLRFDGVPPPEYIDITSLISLRSILLILPTIHLPFHPLIQLLEKIPPPRNFELIHVLFTESFHLLTDFFKTDWDPIDVLFSRPGLFRKIKVEFVTCVHWPESKQEEWESLIVKQLPLSEQLGILTANVRVVCDSPSPFRTSMCPQWHDPPTLR